MRQTPGAGDTLGRGGSLLFVLSKQRQAAQVIHLPGTSCTQQRVSVQRATQTRSSGGELKKHTYRPSAPPPASAS